MQEFRPNTPLRHEIALTVLYVLGGIVAIGCAVFGCEAAEISLQAFDAPAHMQASINLAAFDGQSFQARRPCNVDLSCFEVVEQPQHAVIEPTKAPIVVVNSPTDFRCVPCEVMEKAVGKGDAALTVKWRKCKHTEMPVEVRRMGTAPGYPVIELPDGALVCGRRSLTELKELVRQHAAKKDDESVSLAAP